MTPPPEAPGNKDKAKPASQGSGTWGTDVTYIVPDSLVATSSSPEPPAFVGQYSADLPLPAFFKEPQGSAPYGIANPYGIHRYPAGIVPSEPERVHSSVTNLLTLTADQHRMLSAAPWESEGSANASILAARIGHLQGYIKLVLDAAGTFTATTEAGSATPTQAEDSATSADVQQRGYAIDLALASAGAATDDFDGTVDERAEFFVERAIKLARKHGAGFIRRTVRFLSDPSREFGTQAITALAESDLDARFDRELVEELSRLLALNEPRARYCAVTSLGRRAGKVALSALSTAVPGLADDPILATLAKDYLEARGHDDHAVAKAS